MNFFNRWFRWMRRRKPPQNGRASELVQMLMWKVERTLENEYDCDDVAGLMDQFAELKLQGEDAEHLMPLFQQHLEMCPDCREEFEALMSVLEATADQQ